MKPVTCKISNPTVLNFLKENQHISVEDLLIYTISFLNKIQQAPSDHEILNSIKTMETTLFEKFSSLSTTQTNSLQQYISSISEHSTNAVLNSVNAVINRTDKLDIAVERIQEKLSMSSVSDVLSAIHSLRDTKVQVDMENMKNWMLDQFADHIRGRIVDMKFTEVLEVRNSIDLLLSRSDLDSQRVRDSLGVVDASVRKLQDTFGHRLDKVRDYIDDTSVRQSGLMKTYTDHVERDLGTIRGNLGDILMLKGNLVQLTEVVETFTKPMKSSAKGGLTEVVLEGMLKEMFPMHDIDRIPSSKQKGNMDIHLRKTGYPTVMIDVKKYTRPVPLKEIEKFKEDILLGKNHAILLCIDCCTKEKNHFDIEVNSEYYVSVYLNKVPFGDLSDVNRAVHIIYALDGILEKYRNSQTTSLTFAQIQYAIKQINSTMEQIRMVKNNLSQSVMLIDTILKSGLTSALGVLCVSDFTEVSDASSAS